MCFSDMCFCVFNSSQIKRQRRLIGKNILKVKPGSLLTSIFYKALQQIINFTNNKMCKANK